MRTREPDGPPQDRCGDEQRVASGSPRRQREPRTTVDPGERPLENACEHGRGHPAEQRDDDQDGGHEGPGERVVVEGPDPREHRPDRENAAQDVQRARGDDRVKADHRSAVLRVSSVALVDGLDAPSHGADSPAHPGDAERDDREGQRREGDDRRAEDRGHQAMARSRRHRRVDGSEEQAADDERGDQPHAASTANPLATPAPLIFGRGARSPSPGRGERRRRSAARRSAQHPHLAERPRGCSSPRRPR